MWNTKKIYCEIQKKCHVKYKENILWSTENTYCEMQRKHNGKYKVAKPTVKWKNLFWNIKRTCCKIQKKETVKYKENILGNKKKTNCEV